MRFFLGILVLSLCSCNFFGKENQKNNVISSGSKPFDIETHSNDSIVITKGIADFSNEDFPVEIQEIQENEFRTALAKAVKNDSIPKITDFNQARKLLEGIVTFKINGEEWEQQVPKKINFRSGLTLAEDSAILNEIAFIAYFPTEDILLFEGGHTSDFSFNLTNGKATETTGNPDYVVTSPSNKIRLNGYFGGQECVHYFIQKFQNGQWLKIIELEEIFDIITEKWLCAVNNAFWVDETTLYVSHVYYDEEDISKYTYYKIVIKPIEDKLIWSDFHSISLPKEENSISDIYSSLKVLDKLRAKHLLSGLFPKAENFKQMYSIPFSDNFTSVAVAFQQGEHEFFTVLFNVDKNNQIIDYLIIGYDEIAESATMTRSVLHKDSIIVENESYENFETSTYQINEKGEFVLKAINQKRN